MDYKWACNYSASPFKLFAVLSALYIPIILCHYPPNVSIVLLTLAPFTNAFSLNILCIITYRCLLSLGRLPYPIHFMLGYKVFKFQHSHYNSLRLGLCKTFQLLTWKDEGQNYDVIISGDINAAVQQSDGFFELQRFRGLTCINAGSLQCRSL